MYFGRECGNIRESSLCRRKNQKHLVKGLKKLIESENICFQHHMQHLHLEKVYKDSHEEQLIET